MDRIYKLFRKNSGMTVFLRSFNLTLRAIYFLILCYLKLFFYYYLK